jgi:hypothetical protein
MFVHLGLTSEAANYLARDADIQFLNEIAYLDGKDDEENYIKLLNLPAGSNTV